MHYITARREKRHKRAYAATQLTIWLTKHLLPKSPVLRNKEKIVSLALDWSANAPVTVLHYVLDTFLQSRIFQSIQKLCPGNVSFGGHMVCPNQNMLQEVPSKNARGAR